MHKYIHKIVVLSAAGDSYILLSILHCENDDFSIKINKSEGKISKKKNLWPSANFIFVIKKFGLRPI